MEIIYHGTAVYGMDMEAIFAVMNTTKAVVKLWVLCYKTEILTMVDKHVDVLILDAYFLFQVLKLKYFI